MMVRVTVNGSLEYIDNVHANWMGLKKLMQEIRQDIKDVWIIEHDILKRIPNNFVLSQ